MSAEPRSITKLSYYDKVSDTLSDGYEDTGFTEPPKVTGAS